MGTLIVVIINVLFIIFVYATFSRRVRVLENRRLPEEMRAEIDSLLTTFNRTADTNISLLEDRVKRVTPLIDRAEKVTLKLEGLLRRAEVVGQDLRTPSVPPATPVVQPKQHSAAGLPYDRQRALSSYSGESKSKPAVKKPRSKKATSKNRKKEDTIVKLAEDGLAIDAIARKLSLSEQQVEMRLAFLRSRGSDKGQSG